MEMVSEENGISAIYYHIDLGNHGWLLYKYIANMFAYLYPQAEKDALIYPKVLIFTLINVCYLSFS